MASAGRGNVQGQCTFGQAPRSQSRHHCPAGQDQLLQAHLSLGQGKQRCHRPCQAQPRLGGGEQEEAAVPPGRGAPNKGGLEGSFPSGTSMLDWVLGVSFLQEMPSGLHSASPHPQRCWKTRNRHLGMLRVSGHRLEGERQR